MASVTNGNGYKRAERNGAGRSSSMNIATLRYLKRATSDRSNTVFFAGAVVVAAAAGVTSVTAFNYAALILGLAIVVSARYVPIAPVLILLLVLRAVVDGSSAGNGIKGLGQLASTLGIVIGLFGLGLALANRRGFGPALILGAIMLGSNWYAVENYNSALWREGVRCLTVLGLCLLVLNAKPRIEFATAVRTVQIAAGIPALFAVYQFATKTGMVVDGEIRPAGTLAHPNSAAVLFGFALVVSVYQVVRRRGVKLNIAAAVLFGTSLVVTASVGGVLTVMAMLLVVAFGNTGVRSWIRLIMVALVIVVALAFSESSVGSQRISDFSNLDFTGRPTNSLEWRVSAWRQILKVWAEEPYFGRGLGATTSRLIGVENVPHNEYVRLLTELGLVLFVVMLFGIIFVAVKLHNLQKFAGDTADYANVSLALLAGSFVNAFGANTLLYSVPTYILVLFIGATLASAPTRSKSAGSPDGTQPFDQSSFYAGSFR